jgi:hydrogenase maturation protease
MKIIGCGNPDRGDDGAGAVVAERLRDLGFEAEAHTGDALALLEKWRANDDVIVVDAVLTGAPAGTVHVWESGLPSPAGGGAVSSHGFDIGKAIELARTLRKLPARLRVYGIEGRQFEPGASVSPEVGRAIEIVVQRIATENPYRCWLPA